MSLMDHELRGLRAAWEEKWREAYGSGSSSMAWNTDPSVRLAWWLNRAASDLALAQKCLLDGDRDGVVWALDSLIGGCGPSICDVADAYRESTCPDLQLTALTGQQETLAETAKRAAAEVATWPAWKREGFVAATRGVPKGETQE